MHLERLEGDDVVGSENRRSQRPLWAALTALLVTGLAASLFLASQGVKSTTAAAAAEAQLTVQDQLAPLLTPSDVARPVTSERYQTLSSQVSKRLLSAGPYDGVRLWGPDGTVLYDVERSAVGERAPGEQQRIRRVMQQGRESEVDGTTFLTLVPLRLEVDGPFVGVAALAQPYAPLRSSGSSPWRTAAIGFAAVLLPVLVMLLLTFPGIRRRTPQESTRGGVARGPQQTAPTFADAGHRPDDAEAASAVSGTSMPAEGEPAGSDPGYREAVEARRKAEERASEALEIAERTRLELEELRATATAAEGDDAVRLRRELDEERAAMRASEAERVTLIDRLRETELQRAALAAAPEAAPGAAAGAVPADPAATEALRKMEERALAAEQRLGIAEQRTVQAERQVAATTERTQALEAEALRQSDRAAEAERQAAQAREQLRSTHGELEQIAKATEGTSAEYEAAVVAADSRARQAEARAEAARTEIGELRARLVPAETELAHLREQLTTAERGRVELHDRLAVAEAEASAASDRAAQAEADAAARVLSLDTDMESRIAAIEAAATDRVAEAQARAAEAAATANRAEDELQRAIAARAGAAAPGAGEDEHEIRRILLVTQDRLQRATQRADAAERRAAASDELAARLERELERLHARQEAAALATTPTPAVVAIPTPAAGATLDEAELRRQKLASALMSLHPESASQDEPTGEPQDAEDAEGADETDEQHTTIVPDENMVQLRDLAKEAPADRGMPTSA